MRYLISTTLLLFCLLNLLASEEDQLVIEQFIAKNIDGKISDFSFFYKNPTNLECDVSVFLTASHPLNLSSEKGKVILGNFVDPTKTYPVPHGIYFINYEVFFLVDQITEWKKQKIPIILSWDMPIIYYKQDIPLRFSSHVFLAWDIDSVMDFFHKNQKGCVFAETIKLMDGNNLSFALLVANHTFKKIVFSDLYGNGNQVKLKFPNGRIFTPPLKKDAKNMELNPGESKTFKIELDQLLKESKDFSMKDFEYGLTELVWEIKLDKEQAITRNFWLVKFNGKLPRSLDSGYKLDGPLTIETFLDKKISALPAAKVPSRNRIKKDTESETKETSENKDSSQK